MNDPTNILNQSVGAEINNTKGEYLGTISNLLHDSDGNELQYIVLKCGDFWGPGNRFFAIPANSSLIHITEGGKIVIQLQKDDLQFAQGASAHQYSMPIPKYGLSVYELYNYDED